MTKEEKLVEEWLDERYLKDMRVRKLCKEAYLAGLNYKNKENAELKEQVENRNCSNCRRSKAGCPNDGSCHNFSLWQPFINPELTKAKEIIKKFLEFVNNEVEFDPEHPQEHTDLWNELCEKAEEFISEVEK